ncbi:uncharacterized protein B0T23DRAFT_9646 [Neurospora hispaniola]|uniref:Uncharacterized protein n=1 Tax=Neurospora hispaniola TaxID=588809 RepID=A0AAJ0MVC7_9PEZI|nr:hypothetical protein B0T23DRAFT_9646 [Neurospora hispaniola]
MKCDRPNWLCHIFLLGTGLLGHFIGRYIGGLDRTLADLISKLCVGFFITVLFKSDIHIHYTILSISTITL